MKWMLRAILFAKIHLITRMRFKMEYVLVQNNKGKHMPQKVGMAPIMRDGVEYEFTTVFDLDSNHQAVASNAVVMTSNSYPMLNRIKRN